MFHVTEFGEDELSSAPSILHDAPSGLKLELHGELAPLAEEWRAFEQTASATLFQSYAWLDAWVRTAAAMSQERPFIILGRDDGGTPRFIWPMAIRRAHGIRVLGWLGQDHGNYAMGLSDPAFAARSTADDIRRLLARISARFPDLALAHFRNQPETWDGVANPFAALPRQPSPNSGFAVPLEADFEAVYTARLRSRARASLRRKERRLAEVGLVEIGVAETAEDRLAILEVYLRQKARQFRERGIANVFAEPAIQNFYRALARARGLGAHGFENRYLTVGGDIVATLSGVEFAGRFYGLTNSLAAGDLRRWSPGLILLREHIRTCCLRGTRVYDMGIGSGRHKDTWKPEPIPLFESCIPLRARGWPAALAVGARTSAKRIVKNNPHLWSAAQSVRRALRGTRIRDAAGTGTERR